MGIIKAGVVVVNQYCKPDSKIYSGYIKYMDREEAVRTEHVAEFDMFNEYMGNPEKTTGLFTKDNRYLSNDEIQALKKLFEKAQGNGSLMWQTVISFDNLWLEQNGLYDSKSKTLNEDKMRELATNGIKKMLHNEGLDHAIWSAAFHFNTDNIHVHVATVEVDPMREKKIYQQFTYEKNSKNRLVRNGAIVDLEGNPVFREEMKGKFKLKSFELCKQYIVNEIIREKDLNRDINKIIRDRLVRSVKNNVFLQDPELAKVFKELHDQLPDCPKNLMNYNNNIMQPFRKRIDDISDYYIKKYYSEDFARLQELINKQNEMYRAGYGETYRQQDFKESKMQDLYTRMGNSVLKAVRNMQEGISINDIPQEFEGTDERAFASMSDIAPPDIVPPDIDSQDIGPQDITPSEADSWNMNFIEGEMLTSEIESHGNEYAQYRLGTIYVNPDQEVYDLNKGLEYLKEAAGHGNEYAQYRLGTIYVNPDQEVYDLNKGLEYLKEAAGQGNEYAYCKLGDVYLYQLNNIGEAMQWYKSASNIGNMYAKGQILKVAIGTLGSNQQLRRNWEFNKAMRALNKSFQKDFKAWRNMLEYDRELENRLKKRIETEL